MRYLKFGILLLIISYFSIQESRAQSTRDTKAPEVPAPQYQAIKKSSNQSIFKRWFSNSEKDEIKEFRKRMKKEAKKDRKEARLAMKPQYSDPTYFGHKKPPKKRPPGKRKYCEECGLKH